MTRTHLRRALAAVLLLGALLPSSAQTFSGTLQSGWGWFYNSSDLAAAGPQFDAKVAGNVGAAEAPAGQYSIGFQAKLLPGGQTSFALADAWVKAYLGPADVSVGNQTIAWGVTDVFTPLDVVNPRDMSHPLDSVKIPVPSGRVLLTGSGLSLDLVLVPAFAKGVVPEARWQPATTLTPPTGVTIVSRTLVDQVPALIWDNLAWGGRAGASLDVFQGVDFGVTFYQGRNPLPRATVTLASAGTPGQMKATSTLDYDRFLLAGADAVVALEGLVLRTEAAGRLWRDTDPQNPVAGDATAQGVASLEYTLPVIGVKAIAEGVVDWTNTAGYEGTAKAKAVLALSAAPDSRWSWKAVSAWDFDGAGMVSPQLTYTVADGLSATLAGFAFLGDTAVTWGSWNNNSVVEATFKYAF
ncbi:MAG: hypothetical protein WCG80_06330 [Spirochaetales bacterium]